MTIKFLENPSLPNIKFSIFFLPFFASNVTYDDVGESIKTLYTNRYFGSDWFYAV